MGRARIRISWELLRQSLDLPHGWSPKTIYIEEKPQLLGLAQEPSRVINLIVEGDSIAEQPEGSQPLDLEGRFKSKVIDGEDGRWTQGHWELFGN